MHKTKSKSNREISTAIKKQISQAIRQQFLSLMKIGLEYFNASMSDQAKNIKQEANDSSDVSQDKVFLDDVQYRLLSEYSSENSINISQSSRSISSSSISKSLVQSQPDSCFSDRGSTIINPLASEGQQILTNHKNEESIEQSEEVVSNYQQQQQKILKTQEFDHNHQEKSSEINSQNQSSQSSRNSKNSNSPIQCHENNQMKSNEDQQNHYSGYFGQDNQSLAVNIDSNQSSKSLGFTASDKHDIVSNSPLFSFMEESQVSQGSSKHDKMTRKRVQRQKIRQYFANLP